MTRRAAAAPTAAPRGRARRAALGGALALAAALTLAPRAARAQTLERTARFAITEVGDSTFTFGAGDLRWVKTGVRGIAVDPKRRDALVARFEILRVERGTATALVTGETTRLTPDHVAVLDVPVRPWYTSSLFWSGAILGLLGGIFARSL